MRPDRRIAGLVLVAVVALSRVVTTGTDSAVRVLAISARSYPEQVAVLIEASDTVAYEASRPDPLTLHLDLTDVTIDRVSNALESERYGPVERVAIVPAPDGEGARITIALAQPVAHRVRSLHGTIRLEFDRRAPDPPRSAAARVGAGPAHQERGAGDIRGRSEAEALAPATALELVTSRTDAGAVVVTLVGDGALQPAQIGEAQDPPPRVFLDFPGVSSEVPAQIPVDLDPIAQVRVALNSRSPLITRVVLDLTRPADYRVEGVDSARREISLVFPSPESVAERDATESATDVESPGPPAILEAPETARARDSADAPASAEGDLADPVEADAAVPEPPRGLESLVTRDLEGVRRSVIDASERRAAPVAAVPVEPTTVADDSNPRAPRSTEAWAAEDVPAAEWADSLGGADPIESPVPPSPTLEPLSPSTDDGTPGGAADRGADESTPPDPVPAGDPRTPEARPDLPPDIVSPAPAAESDPPTTSSARAVGEPARGRTRRDRVDASAAAAGEAPRAAPPEVPLAATLGAVPSMAPLEAPVGIVPLAAAGLPDVPVATSLAGLPAQPPTAPPTPVEPVALFLDDAAFGRTEPAAIGRLASAAGRDDASTTFLPPVRVVDLSGDSMPLGRAGEAAEPSARATETTDGETPVSLPAVRVDPATRLDVAPGGRASASPAGTSTAALVDDPVLSVAPPAPRVPSGAQPRVMPLAELAQAQAPVMAGQAGQYSGHPVSLDFQNADLRSVLRTFAEISSLNIVIDPAVQGSVDVALTEVPWDQALDIILRANQLSYVVDGSIIRIAPLTVLAEEEAQRRQLAEEQALAGELEFRTRTPSYARADALADLLTRSVLSPRGQVEIDARTNTLIITDLPDRVDDAMRLIDTLDIPEAQVEIEARIVQTTTAFARELGVQWGITGRVAPEMGNTTSLAFPNRGSLTGRAGTESPSQGPFGVDSRALESEQSGTAVNLGVSNPAGAIGLALGAVDGSLNLDLALSALEASGNGRILSTPRVTTQNNVEAEVKQGIQIPIQTVANNTVTVSFKDAALSLRVTPQINYLAETIILGIILENAAADFTREVNGIPPINTQYATTQVQVNDGATTVIGGIFTSNEEQLDTRVPFLHRIPLLGWLFRKSQNTRDSRELLIFITPRIIDDPRASRRPAAGGG